MNIAVAGETVIHRFSPVAWTGTLSNQGTYMCSWRILVIFRCDKNLYSLCPSPEGMKDALYNKFWTLRIGQNSRALCTNMAVMEMHCRCQEWEVLGPRVREAGLAGHWASSKVKGEVDCCCTCIDSPVVSTLMTFEWSKTVAIARKYVARAAAA